MSHRERLKAGDGFLAQRRGWYSRCAACRSAMVSALIDHRPIWACCGCGERFGRERTRAVKK